MTYTMGGVVYVIIIFQDKVFNAWLRVSSCRASILSLVCLYLDLEALSVPVFVPRPSHE